MAAFTWNLIDAGRSMLTLFLLCTVISPHDISPLPVSWHGTYQGTRTLAVKTSVGPWVYGESRDGVIIRLIGTPFTRSHCSHALQTATIWASGSLRMNWVS